MSPSSTIWLRFNGIISAPVGCTRRARMVLSLTMQSTGHNESVLVGNAELANQNSDGSTNIQGPWSVQMAVHDGPNRSMNALLAMETAFRQNFSQS